MEVKISEEVQAALTRFDAGPITHQQFAQHIGFSERDMYFLELFHPAVFNKSWLLLDRDMVKEWFCKNDTSARAVNNFIDRVLTKMFTEGVDYKKADENDPEVIKSHVSNLRHGKVHTGGLKKQYFFVTGECLKAIGMMQNKEIRDYYLKIEKVFYQMCEYMMQAQVINVNKRVSAQITMTQEAQLKAENEQKNAENARAEAAEATEKLKNAEAELKKAKDGASLINAHVELTQEYHELGTFYIMTSLDDHAKKIYKPGHVTSTDIKSFRERLANYNTRGTDRTLYFPVYVRHVYNAHQFDARVKAALSLFKGNKNKEILVIDLDDLIEICDHLAAQNDADMEFMNKFARERFRQGIARPSRDVSEYVQKKVELPPMKKKAISEFTKDELNATITSALERYMRKQKDDEKWTMSRGLVGERVVWNEISEIIMAILDVKRAKLCATVWTAEFKELAKKHKFQFIHHLRSKDGGAVVAPE